MIEEDEALITLGGYLIGLGCAFGIGYDYGNGGIGAPFEMAMGTMLMTIIAMILLVMVIK